MDNHHKLIEHYYDWDFQIKSCESLEEIDDFDISRAENSLNYLKSFLGEGFPKQVMISNTRFRTFFWNKAPWTRIWFIWLAEAISNLKQCKNFEVVLKKLKSNNPDEFEEAVLLLEYGLKFIKSGFDLDFEIETINGNNVTKKPDIFLINPKTGENIFVEVTRLKPNPEMDELSNIFHRVHFSGMMQGKQINCSGRIFKSMSKERLHEVKIEIDKKVQLSIKNNSFEELKISGVIEMAFAGQGHITTLVQWAEKHNYKVDSLILPDIDKFKRLKGKITRKSSQSSPTCANLLIIKNDDFHSISNPEHTFYELEETLYNCEDLLGVIIVSHQFGGQDKSIVSYGMHSFITKTERYALTSLTGIMLNKYFYKTPITLNSLTKIRESFDIN